MDSSMGQEEDPLKAILNLLPPEGTSGSKNASHEHHHSREGALFDLNSPPQHNLTDIADNFELPMFNIDSQHAVNSHLPFKNSRASNQATLTTDTLQFIDLGLAPPERRGRSSSFSGSVLSDVLLNPNLPFMDAMLQFLGYDNPPTMQEQQYQLPQSLFFDQEIQLGGLVSSTNLNNMLYANQGQLGHGRLTQGNLELLDEPGQGGQAHSMALDNNYQRYFTEQQPTYGAGAMFNVTELSPGSIDPSSSATNGGTPAEYTIPSYLADPMAGNGSRGDTALENQYAGVTISIDAAPEAQAARTPSLFSNSLHGSQSNSPAVLNSGHGGNGSSTHLNANGSYQHLPVLSPGLLSDYSELLKPDEFAQIRRGRKVQHAASRLRSRLRLPYSDNEGPDGLDIDNERDYDDEVEESGGKKGPSSSREKMLELALPNQVMKRTQKHPSVYACHLCEKRFTRPYNLKSHLRTHTDERPFICNVCGKAFARQHDRKRHEDLHSGEKKYQCRGLLKSGQPYGCGRKFARADALRRHFQTETGKECIRLLLEEDERERDDPLKREGSEGISAFEIPTVAISPPD